MNWLRSAVISIVGRGGEPIGSIVCSVGSADGQVQALPLQQIFPYGQAVEAFRCLSQAKHIGKVVLVAEVPKLVQPNCYSLQAQVY